MDAIYARVSTEEQAKSGYSIQNQVRVCKDRFPEAKEFIDDGYSGEFLDRPALDSLRKYLKEKSISNLIMLDPDRMSRNLTHMLLIADEIEKSGAQLSFITGDYDASPEGKLFFSIRGAVAAFEKAKTRERTMAGKRQKALSGKLTYNDGAFGYDFDKDNSMYVINKNESEIIKLIFKLYIEEQMGVRALSLYLKSIGIINRKGNPFTPTNIYRILKNEMYAGTKWAFKTYDKKISQRKKQKIIRDKSQWVPITVPAIIDIDTWLKAQSVSQSKKIFSKRNNQHEYLLRGLIKCADCGYAMIGSRKLNKGVEYFYYTCSSQTEKRKCNNGTVRADVLDNAVWNTIYDETVKHKNFNILNKQVDNSVIIEKLTTTISKLQEKKKVILKWVNDEIVTFEEAEKELHEINKELLLAQNTLSGLDVKQNLISEDILDSIKVANTFEEKRNVMLKLNTPVYAKRTGWKPTDIKWRF